MHYKNLEDAYGATVVEIFRNCIVDNRKVCREERSVTDRAYENGILLPVCKLKDRFTEGSFELTLLDR